MYAISYLRLAILGSLSTRDEQIAGKARVLLLSVLGGVRGKGTSRGRGLSSSRVTVEGQVDCCGVWLALLLPYYCGVSLALRLGIVVVCG